MFIPIFPVIQMVKRVLEMSRIKIKAKIWYSHYECGTWRGPHTAGYRAGSASFGWAGGDGLARGCCSHCTWLNIWGNLYLLFGFCLLSYTILQPNKVIQLLYRFVVVLRIINRGYKRTKPGTYVHVSLPAYIYIYMEVTTLNFGQYVTLYSLKWSSIIIAG